MYYTLLLHQICVKSDFVRAMCCESRHLYNDYPTIDHQLTMDEAELSESESGSSGNKCQGIGRVRREERS